MTREELIALAKEAGCVVSNGGPHQGWAMRNDDPFEDSVREIATIRARKP